MALSGYPSIGAAGPGLVTNVGAGFGIGASGGGGSRFNPYGLPGLVADYDASIAASVTASANRVSAWADQSGLGHNLLQGTGANQPLYLPYAGTNYAYNNGVAANTLTTPTQTVTGSKTFAFDFTLADYSPGSNVTLFDKLSGNNGIRVLLLTTGVIRLVIGDGSAATNVDSTTATTLVDGARGTIGIVWTDGVGASFTQNGSALGTAVASVHTLTNAAVSATIGPWTGSIYSVIVTGGVGVFNMSPSATTNNATSWTASTGEVWTVNSTGFFPVQIVGASSILCDGSAYYLQAAFTINQPETIYLVGLSNVFQNFGYIWDGSTNDHGSLYQVNPTPNIELSANGTTGPLLTTWTLRTNAVLTGIYNGASSSLRKNLNTAIAASTAATNSGGFTIGGRGGGNSFSSIQVNEVIIYNVAHDATTQARIISYLGAKWNIAV